MSDAPTPRRTARPRWLDVRVLGGVLLLVASVVIGARVIGASSRTGPVWVAASDLAAGTVLQQPDLVRAEVNLGGRGSSYLDGSISPVGRALNRAVHAGELLPAAAVGVVGDGRIVSVAVAPERMAPGVQHGSVIDLYLTSGGTGADAGDAMTRLLQAGVTVQSVTAPASGGLSGATSSRYQVAVLLSPADADALVRVLPTGQPLVVLRTDRAAGGGAGGAAGGDGQSAGVAPSRSPDPMSGRPTVADGLPATPATGSSAITRAAGG